jgi:hypothetical protein
MTSWLVAAMALGLIVAWLLSKLTYQRKFKDKEDTFSAVILERNNMIDKLEKSVRNKTVMFQKLSNDLKNSQESLAEKTSGLTTLQHRLDNTTSNENTSVALKEKNNLLRIEIQKLKEADIKRLEELKGFEEVLLFAEEKIEENEKSYRQIIKKLDDDIECLTLEAEERKKGQHLDKKTISDLEEALTLYEADSSAPEFIISKDQFVKIEEQLGTYQKEIESLKSENREFFLKLKKSSGAFEEEKILENKTVYALQKENDDSSMVKVFRETYKKITKS